MPRGTAQQGLLLAWLGLVVMEVARADTGASGFQWPQPRLIIAPAVVYSVLSVVALASSPLAMALGLGIDVAVAINPAVMQRTNTVLTRIVGVSGASSTAADNNPLAGPAPAYPLVASGGGKGLSMQS